MASGGSPPKKQKLPEICQTGEATPEAIWQAVGKALNIWETLQYSVALVFQMLVRESELISLAHIAMHRVYGMLTNPKAQADAIQAAAQVRIPDETELRKRLNVLLENLRIEANKRNNIAHGALGYLAGPIMGAGLPPDDNIARWSTTDADGRETKQEKPVVYWLGPPGYNAARNKWNRDMALFPGDPDYRYNVAKIEEIASGWSEFTQEAFSLSGVLLGACERADEAFRKKFSP
jgi:hypothetical protein